MFGDLGKSDVGSDVEEEISFDEEPAPVLGMQSEDTDAALPAASAATTGYGFLTMDPPPTNPHIDTLHTTRTDTLASYGQLVAPSTDQVAAVPLGKAQDEISALDRHSNGADSNAEASGSVGARTAGAQALLKITVTDPVKKVEQSLIPGVSGGYVTYKVSTVTALPSFTHKEAAVRRRFRDFVALADLLAVTHRGYFIPPRPDKNPVEGQRASAEFVEQRCQQLERYLQKLAEHPVICKSEELRIFLETEGLLGSCYQWQQLQPMQSSTLEGLARLPKQMFGSDQAIPAPAEAAQSTSRTGDLMRRFKELGASWKSEHKKAAAVTLDESNLRGDSSMVEEYQEALAGSSRKAEKLVRKLEDFSNVLGDLGLSFIKIAKFEDEDGSKTGVYTDSGAASKQLSADTRRLGMAAVRLSRLSRSAVSQDISALSVLHEELGLTPCILKALREREGQLLTVSTLQAELEKKRFGIQQLEQEGSKKLGGDKAKLRKVTALQNDVAALEAALTAAQAEYDRVKDRNKLELERWRSTRAGGFAGMLEQYGHLESAYAERSLSVWLGVAEEFGAGQEVASRIQATLHT